MRMNLGQKGVLSELLQRRTVATPSSTAARVIELVLDMPPSVNALYGKRRGGAKGGVFLTDAAKKYANRVKEIVAKHVTVLKNDFRDLEAAYKFDVVAYFEELENPGWFERFQKGPRAGERKAKTRYKRIDVDNRVKFAQDCVTKALGIPGDEQVFDGSQAKKKGTPARLLVRLSVVDPAEYLEEG